MKKFVSVIFSLVIMASIAIASVSALEISNVSEVNAIIEETAGLYQTSGTAKQTQAKEQTLFKNEPLTTQPQSINSDMPIKIKLSTHQINMGVGEKSYLSAEIINSAGNNLEWSVSNSNVASLNTKKGTGVTITAKKEGKTTISVKSSDGLTETCIVTVMKAPSSVNIYENSLTLGVGEVFTLGAVTSSKSWSTDFTWTSSNTSVAMVKKSNANKAVVTALSTGKTTIKVKTFNGKTDSLNITVKKAPNSVKINKSAVNIGLGDSIQISESTNSGSYSQKFTWSSSDETVAAVTKLEKNKAKVTAVGKGTAVVTITTYNGKTAECVVTVKKAPSKVTLSKESLTLGAKETFEISEKTDKDSWASNFKWSSSNSKVASVSRTSGGKAKITAKAVGSAVVSITTYNGKTANCKVVVKSEPKSVSLNKTSMSIGIGESYGIFATTNIGSYARNFTWSSSNSKVATVKKTSDNKAKITAVGSGTAKIKVKLYNGKTATCNVTVKKMATSVNLNCTSIKMLKGETYDLNSNVPSDSAAYFRYYSISNSKVATVNGDGLINAKAKGNTIVTVKLSNGTKADCKVQVISDTIKKKTTKKTTLRVEPRWDSGTVATVNGGTTVYQYDQTGNWMKVKAGSNYGWIYNKALGVSKNYTKINTQTLPTVADDILFDIGTSMKSIYNYVYNIGYRRVANDNVKNLCVYILQNGRGACYHHAALLYYLLDRAGYEALIVNGIDLYTGGGPHAWCMVKTNGKWRHIDPTAITGLTTGSYRFYLVTDAVIKPYFVWDRSKYPAAK